MSTHIGNSQEILMEKKSSTSKIIAFCAVFSAIGVICLIIGLSVVGSNLDTLEETVAEIQEKPKTTCLTEVCHQAAKSLIDTMDLTKNPCDDFFEYACGKFRNQTSRPSDASRWGQFSVLRKNLTDGVKKFLEMGDKPYYTARLKEAIRLFQKCKKDVPDTELQPYKTSFGKLFKEENFPLQNVPNDVHTLIQLNIMYNARSMFDVFVSRHQTESINTLYMDQPQLALPKEVYVTKEPKKRIDAYMQLMRSLSIAFGTAKPDENLLKNIFDFETKVANILVNEEDRRDESTIQEVDPANAEFKINIDNVPQKISLKDIYKQVTRGDIHGKVYMAASKYFQKTLDVDKLTLGNFFAWGFLFKYAKYINNKSIQDAYNEYEKSTLGVSEATSRENYCQGILTDTYGMAISSEYVPLTFQREAKTEMDEMVTNLKSSFKGMLKDLDWLHSNTKVASTMKVDRMIPHIAYPSDMYDEEGVNNAFIEEWFEYFDLHLKQEETLQLDDTKNFATNMITIQSFFVEMDYFSHNTPAIRKKWIAHPSIVNAFYSPQHNSITFPAGILQFPFYSYGRPGYMNYGAIGSVIGHEITHGFDDEGRQRDAVGNLEKWWTPDDIKKYQEKVDCFQKEYDNEIYTIGKQNMNVSGKRTVGENIADNGGILEAYLAYQTYKETHQELQLPHFEDFSEEQMFFISYAQNWCEVITDEALELQLMTDPHAPARSRVNVVMRNTPEFQQAFQCPKPKDVCKLW